MNYFENKGRATPAKKYPANPWRLYDMHGNVWEWTSDYYAEDYPTGAAIDPKGPKSGSDRVGRGGSWVGGAGNCRSAFRNALDAADRSDNLGFRFHLSCD